MIQVNKITTAGHPQGENWYDMKETAKIISVNGIGRTKLFKFLRDNQVINGSNEPYQQFIDRGYFKYVIKDITNSYGQILFVQTVTLVSLKGMEYIKQLLTNNQGNYATS